MSEHNMKSIRKGDTWILDLKFWGGACQTDPINVSTYTFKLMAKNGAGTTQFTWNNADFVVGDTNERTVTLSAVTTATYNVGCFNYDLQVTTPTGTWTWMTGFITVEDQITS
jgi:hypothetical protein